MAIVVEDGTGLSNAETYASLVEFRAYCDARGYDDTAASDTTVEQKLRLAAEFIDGAYRFKGLRSKSTQALEFPRTGLVDWSGISITGVPTRLKNATIELAFKALSEASLFVDDEKRGVKSETVGPLSVTYTDSGAAAGKDFTVAKSLLAQYLYEGPLTSLGGPTAATIGTDSIFSIGMHDTPGSAASPLLSE